MTHQGIVAELTRLAQLDVDTIVAYDHAVAAIGEGPVARELSSFKLDHERHVIEISQALLGMGKNAPEVSPDLKGSILGTMTGLRARLGAEQALRAMRTNEQLTTASYARALATPFPEPILAVIRRGDADERRHLAWIEQALDRRLWEQGEAARP